MRPFMNFGAGRPDVAEVRDVHVRAVEHHELHRPAPWRLKKLDPLDEAASGARGGPSPRRAPRMPLWPRLEGLLKEKKLAASCPGVTW